MRTGTSLLSSHDGLAVRCLTRQLAAVSLGSSSCSTSPARRNFSSSSRRRAEGTASEESSKSRIADILASDSSSTSTATNPAASSSSSIPAGRPPRVNLPTQTSAGRSYMQPKHVANVGYPYILNAHCTKHNTILSLTKDIRGSLDSFRSNKDVEGLFGAHASGRGVDEGPVDPKIYGQVVLRVSPGMVGLKKSHRSTFEAGSRAALLMFERIEKLGWDITTF